MATTITVRLNDDTAHELDELTSQGQSRDAVVRYALKLAYRARAEERMRHESTALLRDLEDQREIAVARKAMGSGGPVD